MEREVVWTSKPVSTWAEFHRRVKLPGRELLAHLDEFGDTILVAGCQRSGTTALTHVLCRAEGMADYLFGPDSELDGALLLAGRVARFSAGRHCFQTTYLNDRFPEYFDHDSFRLIWILREPRSVVYSMLNNWKRAALDRLYHACGITRLEDLRRGPWMWDRYRSPSRLEKACASYMAKMGQTFTLHRRLGERMLVIDYDDLVSDADCVLQMVADFAEVPFHGSLAGHLHRRSIRKGDRLAPWQLARVEELCSGTYLAARNLCVS